MYIHTYITRDLYTIVNSRAHSMQYMYMYIYLLRSGSQRQREVGDWVSLGVQLILNITKKKKEKRLPSCLQGTLHCHAYSLCPPKALQLACTRGKIYIRT